MTCSRVPVAAILLRVGNVEGKRSCIKCQSGMDAADVLGVEIDCCPGCGGIWLDGGEIQALAKQPDDSLKQVQELRARLIDPSSGSAAQKAAAASEQDILDSACPGCANKLARVVFGPTVAEHCTKCLGLFLDHGELEKAMMLVKSDRATTIVALVQSAHTSGLIGG